MNRAVLLALSFAASYPLSFHSPGSSLTETSPGRVEPSQRPLVEGFWGASGELLLIGPDLGELYEKKDAGIPEPYSVSVDFNSVLKYDFKTSQSTDSADRGFLRMIPHMWYGAHRVASHGYVPDGAAACSGVFYRLPYRRPFIPHGWRIFDETKRKIPIQTTYPNTGIAGGGIRTTLQEPEGWRLAEVRLTPQAAYVISFGSAWESPYSSWEGKKPTESEMAAYELIPTVWAEVTDAVLENIQTGERRKTQTPTGWVEAAGRFRRRAGSGW